MKVTVELIKKVGILPDSDLAQVGEEWFLDLDTKRYYRVQIIDDQVMVTKIRFSYRKSKPHRLRIECSVCGDIRITTWDGWAATRCKPCQLQNDYLRYAAWLRKSRKAYRKKHGLKDLRLKENRVKKHWKADKTHPAYVRKYGETGTDRSTR